MSLSKGSKLKKGKYIIEHKLTDGSYGVIYKAIDKPSGTFVAIKTLSKPLRHSKYKDDLKRFKKEAKVLEKVSWHPNIVTFLDFFKEKDERYYLVMELLSGETLGELVDKEGDLSDSFVLDYIYQIGLALKAFHREDWVHRDVHPGNIMIAENKAILIDFGYAGNPKFPTIVHPANDHFTPWEQKEGNLKPTVDIYALAACFYYALTAQLPETSTKRKESKDELFILPSQYNPSISQKAEEAILKGMQLYARNRPQSIQKWLKLLPKTKSWFWYWLIEVLLSIVGCLNKFFHYDGANAIIYRIYANL